jgi:hypothetical protein
VPTARALLAFQAYRGRSSATELEYDEAFTGALIWSDHINDLRNVKAMLESLGKGGKRR